MQSAPLPKNESKRIKVLTELSLLDSRNEEEFDALVRAAASICDVPISLISLVDTDRQWFKANHGLEDAKETSREIAFCAHTILNNDIFEISDATKDDRFEDNPLVSNDPHIRFYAGVPLTMQDGSNIGTLCVIDRQPKQLSETQRTILIELGKIAVHTIQNRQRLLELENNHAQFQGISESSPMGIYATNAFGACTYTNERWQKIFGLSADESLGTGWTDGLHPDDKELVFQNWQESAKNQTDFDMEFRTYKPGGELRIVHSTARQTFDKHGHCAGFVGTVEDITEKIAVRKINESLLTMIRDHKIMSITDIHGDIIEANDAFCKISGYSREELIGKNHRVISSGHHPRSFFSDMWKRISTGNSWEGEICNLSKSGSRYWVDSIIAPLRSPDGTIDRFVSIRTDVTNRHDQQEAIRQNATFLERIGRIAGVGGWEIDLLNQHIYWSDETCRIHGVEVGFRPSIEEAIHFFAEEARPIIRHALETSVDTKAPWDLTLPLITRQGKSIFVRAFGVPEFEAGKARRLVGAFQDVTAIVEQNQRLEESKSRMELATDSGQIGVWEYNVTDQSLAWDRWMYRLYGMEANCATNTYDLWASHLHPEDKADAERAVQESLFGNREFSTEFRIIQKNGEVRYIKGAARIDRDANGCPLKMIGVNWDVTERRQVEAALAQQYELLRVTLNSIGDSVITTDDYGKVTWLNPVAERMTGWANHEASGKPLSQIFHILDEETRLPIENPVYTCLQQGKIIGLANHTVLISRNGEEFGIEDSASPILDSKGDLLGVVLVFHDVTEQRRMSGEMSYRATHDELTNLVNRAEFETRLRRLLQKAHEDDSVHTLLYIDLDQFKVVNDSCGHSAGDQLLQQVSKLMSEGVRSGDTLARLGGDEFGVILNHCSGEQAHRVAQQICDRIDEFRFIHDGRRFRIGTSIGLVQVSKVFPTTAAIMQAADTSCYAAKEAGRNRVHVWFDTDQAMRARHGEMQWTTRIEQALDDNRFVLYAQHIEKLAPSTSGIHAEVLIRMLDTDDSIIPPGAFLPAAERYHLASRIDRWVVKNVIQWLQGISDLSIIDTISLNLSGQSIGDRAFHRHLMEKLAECDREICTRLCIEITETSTITNLSDAALFIDAVHALGVRIALDDFGAGASSFGYLKNLKVDYIKIDGQFIKDIIDDPLDDAAVRCFIDVAKVLNVKTIAEYVDKQSVLERITQLGIDFAQGFHLHKPEPIDRLISTPIASPLSLDHVHTQLMD